MAPAQAVASYDRGQREGLGDPDAAWPWQGLALGAGGEPEQVAGADAGAGQRRPGTRPIDGVSGSTIGRARTRWGAVRCIRIPRSTALSWATSSWPLAR